MSRLRRTTVPALCCECGNQRTVSASYRRYDANHSYDVGDPRGWRATVTLKCDPCQQPTRHALLHADSPTPEHLAGVRIPAGAVYVAEWGPAPTPDPDRYFRGTKRVIDRTDDPRNGDIEVEIWGTQTPKAWFTGTSMSLRAVMSASPSAAPPTPEHSAKP